MKKGLICLILILSLSTSIASLTMKLRAINDSHVVVTVDKSFNFSQLVETIKDQKLEDKVNELYYDDDSKLAYSLFDSIESYISIFEENGLDMNKFNENLSNVKTLSETSGISCTSYKYWYDKDYQYLLKTVDNFGEPTSSIEITPFYDNSNMELLNDGFRKNEDGGYTKYYPFGEIHLIEDDEVFNIYTSFNYMLLDYYGDSTKYYISEVKNTLDKLDIKNINDISDSLQASLTLTSRDTENSFYSIHVEVTDEIEQIKEVEMIINK